MTTQQNKNELKAILQDATSFHGHFGPFLVIGVKMGLAGLRKLGVERGDTQLHATVFLEYLVPKSCTLDGVQTSTKCTVGNKRLTWKESRNIGAVFELGRSKERRVEIWVNPAVVDELKHRLAKLHSDEAISQIGWDIAARSDAQLFMSESGKRLHDLDIAKNQLRKNKCALVVVKNGRILFETDASGIKGFLNAPDRIGKNMKGSSAADKIVGEAAAQLCAYSGVREVYAVTMSQCGKDLLEKNHIAYEYENLVPHILNNKKSDLCPFEKIVAGSRTPEEAYRRLKKATAASA